MDATAAAPSAPEEAGPAATAGQLSALAPPASAALHPVAETFDDEEEMGPVPGAGWPDAQMDPENEERAWEAAWGGT